MGDSTQRQANSPAVSLTKKLASALFLLMQLAFCVWCLSRMPWQVRVAMVLLVLFCTLGVLMNERHPWIGKTALTVFSGYVIFTLWLIASILPTALFICLSRSVVCHWPSWAQGIAFGFWAALLGLLLSFILTQESRVKLFQMLRKFGKMAPLVYSFNALSMSLVFFSALTLSMVGPEAFESTKKAALPLTQGNLMDYYVWHFLDAIPILKVNDTLKWEEPLRHKSAVVGWLLLLFKIMVIGPVIAAFVGYQASAKNETKQELITA